jgi:sec-independent protein translocase protein TatC
VAITSRLRRGGGSDDRRPRPTDGQMTLAEHLRELRNRLIVSVLAIIVGFVVAWIFYNDIYQALLHPFREVQAQVCTGDRDCRVTMSTIGAPFILQAKISLMAGIVIASPVWLYELWAFIMPGLHANERRWTLIFVAIAGPLFAGGVALGYYVMPKGISVLLGFTPHGVSNFIDSEHYLDFIVRVLLVFGISFEIPFFVVLLNLAGAVRAHHLARWRSWIIFGTFVFAAVATPSTDPFTMLMLATPMVVLFLISEAIAHFVDRRRGISEEPDYGDFGDDETSPV